MNIKKLTLVIGLLALVSLVVFLVQRPSDEVSPDPRVGSALVDPSLVQQAAKVRLSDQGRTVLLVRKEDTSWEVESYHGMPADFQKLSSLVDSLFKGRVDRFVSARKERVEGFGFGASSIALLNANGTELWTLGLGKNAEGGGRLLRFGVEEKAYLTRATLWLDAEPKNWADTMLMELKEEELSRLEFSFPGGRSLVVQRRDKNSPFEAVDAPAGKRLAVDKIRSLIGALSSLRFTDTCETADPRVAEASPHARSVRLVSFDGSARDIALSRKPEQKVLKKPDETKSLKPGDVVAKLEAKAKEDKPSSPEKVIEPMTETIPAGPVFVRITQSEPKAGINALMARRAFMVYEYAYNSMPDSPEALLEAEAVPSAEQPKPEEAPKS